jgi:hypothetical protein
VIASSAVGLTLFIILFRDPLLTKGGPLSNAKLNVYTFLITVSATLLTSFIAGQLQLLWVRDIDIKLEEATSASQLENLDARWRTSMKIGHYGERFKNFSVETSYVVAALITSCFVAGVSPNLATMVVPYNATSPDGTEYYCAESFSPQDFSNLFGNQTTIDGTYTWPNPTIHAGTMVNEMFVVTDQPGCPLNGGTSVPSAINFNPNLFVYWGMGVAVQNSLIGAPASIFGSNPGRDDEILELTYTHQSSLELTSQCVPVIVNNPISCRPGGTVQLSQQNMSVTSPDGKCKH